MEWLYTILLLSCLAMTAILQSVERQPRFWLSGFMLFLVGYLGLILLDAQDFFIAPQLYFVFLSIIFLPGPLLLGYIGHISTRQTAGLKDFSLCLLPIMCIIAAPDLISSVPWLGNARIEDYQQNGYTRLFNLVSLMAGVQFIVYMIASFRLMMTMRLDWASYQSRTLPNSWHKMVQVLMVMLCVALLQVISALTNPAGNVASIGDISFIILVLYFIYLAMCTAYGKAQTEDLILQKDDFAQTPEQETSSSVQPEPDQKYQWIVDKVKQQELYLQEDLSLPTMAEQLDMTPHKLSEAINNTLDVSFYDFINEFRVKHAADLLLADPKRSITDIYYSAGFTAKSTFYNYFKKAYGCTPTEYRKREAEK